MRCSTFLSVLPFAALVSTIGCSGAEVGGDGNGDGDSGVGATGNASAPGAGTGGTGATGTDPNAPGAGATGAVDPNADPSCPMMCEITETIEVPLEGGGAMCSAEEYVPGGQYPGGSVVAFEGSEYTSNYWTDISPGIGSGAEAGSPWAPGVPCPGGGGATETQEVTSFVCCEAQPTEAPPQTQTCPLDAILGEEGFNTWFRARRDPFYTYANLCVAIESFPGFASSGTEEQNKREVAAFFANVARETGELDYIDQFPETRGSTGDYYGRGPIQITWNYNYEAAGDRLGVDLLGNPSLVSTDGVVTWQTALWFWMEADGAGKGTCHDAIMSGNFGQTINIINGGLECPSAGNQAAQQRVGYYTSFCGLMSVDPGTSTDC